MNTRMFDYSNCLSRLRVHLLDIVDFTQEERMELFEDFQEMISSGWWQNHSTKGRYHKYKTFSEFVKDPQGGLGTTIEELKDACWDHREALAAIDRASAEYPVDNINNEDPPSRQSPSPEVDIIHADEKGEDSVDIINAQPTTKPLSVDNINSNPKPHTSPRPTGTSKEAAKRRLEKDRPDLFERASRGEISWNAAMVEAGYRKRTYTIKHDPTHVARVIRTQFSAQERTAIIELLGGQ